VHRLVAIALARGARRVFRNPHTGGLKLESADVRVGDREAMLGEHHAIGQALLLPARIGHVRAFAMFALGDGISGRDAVTLGVANKALPKEEVLSAAREAARTLATRPLGAIIATKKLMRDRERILARIEEKSSVFGERLQTDSRVAERRAPCMIVV